MVVVLASLGIILLFVLYMIKLTLNLPKYKDNVLRELATVDSILIKRNELMIEIIGLVRDYFPEKSVIINDLLKSRLELNSLPQKFNNADERHQAQNNVDKKFAILRNALNNYPQLKKNIRLQSMLQEMEINDGMLNMQVEKFNNAIDKLDSFIHSFPSNIIAAVNKVELKQKKYIR
jgi:hypothetical protein